MTSFLPLELQFKHLAQGNTSFPSTQINYFDQYSALLNFLRTNVYKDIDAGLAANSRLPGFYTAHNAEHFDEVVRYAGYLLGVQTGDEKTKLTAYELYILLIAIRIHDAGNIHGREGHEKKCFNILINAGAGCGSDNAEKKHIALIAEAHGGKTGEGSKDTIGRLNAKEALGNDYIRPQLLASIVRFADEICESRCRAATYLLNFGNLPNHSQVFHKYAASIQANVPTMDDSRITMKYILKLDDVTREWGCAAKGRKKTTYIVDEILSRLEKMDKERRYCNRFSKEIYTVDSIRATINIVNTNHDVMESILVPELSDSGYPEDSSLNLRERLKEYCGSSLGDRLSQKSAEEKK
jgi:hypothetical protein